MRNLKITKRLTKRNEGWKSQLIIKRKGEEVEEINEEMEKVFNALKRNAPKCLKKAMIDENFEE